MAEQAAVQASIQKWGSEFKSETNTEMNDLITKLHKAGKKDFSNVKVEKSLKYGADNRQRLNVYYPTDASPSSKLPVVLFFHGGGMVGGDTDTTPLFFSNIGNFFASNSCICISSTYRLLPSAKHPDGAEDATAAIKWTLGNSITYGGDASRLTVIGHSAGGSIIGTALWGSFLSRAGIQEKLASSTFIFLSAGLWYDVSKPPTSVNMSAYHRTDNLEQIQREMPQALFKNASLETMRSWPRSWFFLAEYEFEEIVKGTTGCQDAWRATMERELLVEIVEGENHVSYVYGIGTEGSHISERLLKIARG